MARNKRYKKIKIKLWVYILVFLVTLALSIFHYKNGEISIYFPVGGFLLGILIGHIVSRTKKISWDDENDVILMEWDRIGVFILLVYILFIFFKGRIIEDITHFHHASSISLAVLSGTMLGHAIALRKRVWKLHKSNHKG